MKNLFATVTVLFSFISNSQCIKGNCENGEGTYKYIPYNKLFRRTEFLEVEGYGRFEAYANRDSLKYRSIYVSQKNKDTLGNKSCYGTSL